ncbi:MAG TPA: hypothetical protein VMY59_03485 [Candidatus Thermoplasmatota archaeon]|nr:hypothetical protein [Candidatus Thermoplasmatota archaeon]
MKTILRRKDNTSIFCPTTHKQNIPYADKTKAIKLTIGCSLLAIGLLIMIIAQ